MHGIVSNLEKRGFIERKSDVSHGRILCTELTNQGREVVIQAHDAIRIVEERMLATISREHKELFGKLLLEYFINLNNIMK